ncbi:MAG: long-chain fatty acid--CoA ligase [Magnetococcales bacterium]|nr:long-chain fatty acid--CoA ligase [Magnetococcales bacterium]
MKRQTFAITPPWRVNTLCDLFRERIRESPNSVAYKYFVADSNSWVDLTWLGMQQLVGRWQKALNNEGYEPGDRVAVLLNNSPDWVAFDQAAMGLGLVVVPLFVNDNPQNIIHILQDSGARFLLLQEAQTWQKLAAKTEQFPDLKRVVCMGECPKKRKSGSVFMPASVWLPQTGDALYFGDGDENKLATIIYTSGTTGPAKGVMLSHKNILKNAYGSLRLIPVFREDIFLSFLPLSHALERMAGYYLPMMAGSQVAFARSIADLADDLITIKPTLLISVPRIYERILLKIREKLQSASPLSHALFNYTLDVGWNRFLYNQGRGKWHFSMLLWPLLDHLVAAKVREKLGGRLRTAVCGGAHLSSEVAQFFIGLDITVVQGYGLTESSPVISVNPIEENSPESVGRPLPGVETKIDSNGELLVRGETVMMGYWNNPQATHEVIDTLGWLHTGDQAQIEKHHIRLTGRLKEIIVLSNGRKIPPSDMEASIIMDPLFEQVLIIGENAPYLSALVVLNSDKWQELAKQHNLDLNAPNQPNSQGFQKLQEILLARIEINLKNFPGFAKVRVVCPILEPWTVENGLITPTLKPKRKRILSYFKAQVEQMYKDHPVFSGV